MYEIKFPWLKNRVNFFYCFFLLNKLLFYHLFFIWFILAIFREKLNSKFRVLLLFNYPRSFIEILQLLSIFLLIFLLMILVSKMLRFISIRLDNMNQTIFYSNLSILAQKLLFSFDLLLRFHQLIRFLYDFLII